MQSQQTIDSDRRVWKVDSWKYELDAHYHWWQKVFFRWVFLPFLRLSHSWFKIPAIKEVTVEGKKITYSWFEDQGVFESAEQAEAACLGEFWGYKPLPLNQLLPRESIKYGTKIYPRSSKPDREKNIKFELVPTPRQMLKGIHESVAKLDRILDQ